MMIGRLWSWALRRKTLPMGHRKGCRGGLEALPGEPYRIVNVQGLRLKIVNCDCYASHELRPPTLYEAVFGISNT